MFRMAFVIVLTTLGASATAATIQEVSGSQIGCTLKVSGLLEDGDAERLASYVGDGWQGRICFDSPGGSFMEGLELAKAMPRAATGVDAGDRCESACFLAFMAGTWHRMEDRTPVTDRVMHPRARVGYHAPSLRLPGGQYGATEVSEAYNLALLTIAELVQFRNERQVNRSYGELYEFRDELLEDMMRTPPDTMRYVETVGDAAFFNIQIHPVELPVNLTHRHAAQACKALGRISTDFDMTEQYEQPEFARDTRNSFSFTAYFNVGESGSRCQILYPAAERFEPRESDNSLQGTQYSPHWSLGRASVSAWWIDSNDFEVAAYMHFPFEMQIDQLKVPANYTAETIAALEAAWPELNFEQCSATTQHGNSKPTVKRVNTWANLRGSPKLDAEIVGRANIHERVSIMGDGFVTRNEGCQEVCEARPANKSEITECIRDHQIWVPIKTASKSEGYISRMFLE